MDINELLHSVHSLFSKVSLLDLQKRTHTYKQQANGNMQQDIATPLTDCIDKLAACHKAPESPILSTGEGEFLEGNTPVESTQVVNTQTAPVDGMPNDLSENMKSHSQHTSSDSYISDKLKASTWSHIHTAILRAREGDAKTAKLHADIANHAMKEAGHYMEDAEFKLFSEEIKKALDELKQQSA